MGGSDEVYSLLEQADEAANPGLKYYNLQYKGFFAVKATKESHVAEFFVVDPETILQNYDTARSESGALVANYKCDAQLTTMAGTPGSLERTGTCSAIEFDTSRPEVWDLPFPKATSDDSLVTQLEDCGYKQCEFDVTATPTKAPTAGSAATIIVSCHWITVSLAAALAVFVAYA